MSFTLFIDTPCPKCHEPVKVRAIELHLADASLQSNTSDAPTAAM